MILLNKNSVKTMTSEDRVNGLHQCLVDVHTNKIQGDIVECGIWMGGNIVIAKTFFDSLNDNNRYYYGFDTFTGMTAPTDKDSKKAHKTWNNKAKCEASKQDVIEYLMSTDIYDDRINLIEGDVTQTLLIEKNLPDKIAILRLDTDFYNSTQIELKMLFNRLVIGGWIIIDDYGHWSGCKKAVDEFFGEKFIEFNFLKLDYTGIMWKKNII